MKFLLLFAVAAVGLFAADATGKWTGTITAEEGSRVRPAYLVLKQEGTKLTGSGGPDASEQHEISNGKVEDGKLTFEIVAGQALMKFSLKLEGDEIKGDISRERDGEKQAAVLAVKRDK